MTITIAGAVSAEPFIVIRTIAAMMLDPISAENTSHGANQNRPCSRRCSEATPATMKPGSTTDRSITWMGFTHSPASVRLAGTVPETSPDIEWALIARLAEQRSVSFAGSVPLLVDGLPKDRALSIELLERMDRMSDQVQVVVVATDSSAEDWVRHDGSRVAVHSY